MEVEAKKELAKWWAGEMVYAPLWDGWLRDWLGQACLGFHTPWDELNNAQRQDVEGFIKGLHDAGLVDVKIQVKPEGVPYPDDWPMAERRNPL